nr:HesA/MoeB/ThiF family protein [Shewanella olleyana]
MRYSSHVLLEDMGEAGQLKLMSSSVLIIGVGGLGHAVAHQLAAAGVKRISLMDDDCVELSNLPRQLLFNDDDIGEPKVDIAAKKLANAYPDCEITALRQRFVSDEQALFNTVDVVFDCTDNFSSRLVINKSAVCRKTALISAAISGSNGQLFCLDFSQNEMRQANHLSPINQSVADDKDSIELIDKQLKATSGCYQCLYPDDSQVNQSCSQVGVLTSALLSIASMQALLGVNWLKGNPSQRQEIQGKLHLFNAQNLQWRQVAMSQDPNCCICATN